MELLSKIAQFILMISIFILVTFHEFGHYIPAKIFKMKVEKFMLFIDMKFALFKKKIGETTWGIGWLPLGGYVKIAGMVDESMDREQMAKPPQPWEFRSKPTWQRLIVMSGGIIVNFLLAWVILSGLLYTHGEARIEVLFGDQAIVERNGKKVVLNFTTDNKKLMLKTQSQIFMPRIESLIDTVIPNSIASSIGIQKGDQIISTNGVNTRLWSDFVREISSHKNDTLKLEILRNNITVSKTATLNNDGKLGVGPSFENLYTTDKIGLLESIPAGLYKAIWTVSLQVRQFKLLFNKDTEAYKELHGPVGIVKQMNPEWDTTRFWSRLALFSIMLGFMNLLPIPALDGGHIMFLLYEIITRRKPNQRVLEFGQILGFFIVVGFMLWVTIFNDIL